MRSLLLALGIALCFVSVGATQDSQPEQGLQGTADISVGKFLVATEVLQDPRFIQSVILILQHDSEGTVGLVVNRPSKLKVLEAFPKIPALQKSDGMIFVGGPLDVSRVFVLARMKPEEKNHFVRVLDDVAVTGDLEGVISRIELAGWKSKVRVIAGYAGWAAGQLQMEIREGAWNLEQADAASIFDLNPEDIWPELNKRTHLIQARIFSERQASVPAGH